MKDQENTHLSVGLPEALFDLHLWDPLSAQACEEIARFVEKRLPASFRFLHVEACAAGTQHHHMALFEWKPSARHPPTSFVLIPGGTATLGYDRTQSLVPDEEAVREWLDSHLYGMDLITRDAELLRDCFPLEDEEVSAQKSGCHPVFCVKRNSKQTSRERKPTHLLNRSWQNRKMQHRRASSHQEKTR